MIIILICNQEKVFYWIAGVDEDGVPLMHLTVGTYAQKIYKVLIAQVKCFADNGLMIITYGVMHLLIIMSYIVALRLNKRF